MACKADIKKAILDLAFNTLFEGRNTFTRVSEDTISLNNMDDNKNTKAKGTGQAKKIAEERLKTLINKFKNQISGYVNQFDLYSPVTINLRVNPAYIDYEYYRQPKDQQTDPDDINNTIIKPDDRPPIKPEC